MKTIFVVSSASICDGVFECHGIFVRGSYEEAILTAQNSIVDDFGYESWDDYLSHMDPEIIEKNGVYTIHDNNCGHEEYYRIEKVVL